MKTLILVRHAKSDWPENTDDFDRPLAEKGIFNAGKMANFLKSEGIKIDQLISSPALRALSTCEIFGEVYHLKIETDQKLYNASENNLESITYSLDNNFDSIALFSHNNGISNFANSLTEQIMMFPTCGVAGIQMDCDSWENFEAADKKLLFFYEPKKI